MDVNLTKQAVELVEIADAEMKAQVKESEALMIEKQARDKAYADHLEAAVDALIQHQRIAPGRKKEAMEALKDPACLLQTLAKSANPALTQKPPAVGVSEPQAQKQASANGYSAQRSNGRSPADDEYELALGIRR